MKVHGSLGDRAGMGPLKSALRAYALRHRVVSANIANVETPGYSPKRVHFEDVAKRVLGAAKGVSTVTTDPAHIPSKQSGGRIEARVKEARPTERGPQGVNLEGEIVSMVENQLAYRLAVRLLEMKYRQLHSAIRGDVR